MRRSCGVASPREPNLTFNGSMIVPFDQSEPPFWRTSSYDRRTLFSVYHMAPENLRAYMQAFSPAVRDIFESFEFHLQIDRLAKDAPEVRAERVRAAVKLLMQLGAEHGDPAVRRKTAYTRAPQPRPQPGPQIHQHLRSGRAGRFERAAARRRRRRPSS